MMKKRLVSLAGVAALSAGVAAGEASWNVSHPDGLKPLNFSFGELNEALGKAKGFVTVEFGVGSDGKAVNIIVLESTSESLAEAALSSIESSSYRNVGEPKRYKVTYTSTLNNANQSDR